MCIGESQTPNLSFSPFPFNTSIVFVEIINEYIIYALSLSLSIYIYLIHTHTILIAHVGPWNHILLVSNMYYYPNRSQTFKSQELCLPLRDLSSLVSITLGADLMLKNTAFVAPQEEKEMNLFHE